MKKLPDVLVACRRSPDFDHTTIPANLQKPNSLRAGTWALIHVLEGELLYRILEPLSETILVPGTPGVVQPQQLHEVQIMGRVRFYVEYYAAS